MKKYDKLILFIMILQIVGFFAVMEPRRIMAAAGTGNAETEIQNIPQDISEIHLCALGKSRVKLTWEEPSHASCYRIYRREKGEGMYLLLDTVTGGSFTDQGLSYGRDYQYRIIPEARSAAGIVEGKAASVTYRNVKAVSVNHQKYTYTEMKSDIELLAKNYYGLVSYQVIGKSTDGRNIYDVILGNPKAGKTLLVVSTLHAREYMASLLCMNQIEYYLQNYFKKVDKIKVQDTLDKIAIHYIPMANPDGVAISQSGVKKIRGASLRKILGKISKSGTKRWKANARGVDLNYNFPWNFKKDNRRRSAGCSGSRSSSEKETKAIVKLVKQLKKSDNLKGIVNYHAMGSIIYGECKSKVSCAKATARMYKLARSTTGYGKAPSYSGKAGEAGGSFRGYTLYRLFIPTITLEIGTKPCPGPISEFSSIWKKNKNLVLREARLFT